MNLELIVCDEIHNLVRFQYFGKGEGINPHMIAKKQIEKIIKRSTKTKVIALSATPKRAVNEFSIPIHKLSTDKDIRRKVCWKRQQRVKSALYMWLISGKCRSFRSI